MVSAAFPLLPVAVRAAAFPVCLEDHPTCDADAETVA